MKKILDWLSTLPEMSRVDNLFEKKDSKVLFENTTEENAMLILAYRYSQEDRPFIVVCPNLYHAQIVYDKLSLVLSSDEVFFFPQDEFITSELLVSSMELKMERINTITNMLQKKKYVLITHLAGYLKPQRDRKVWEKSIFTLKVGDEINPTKLNEKMFEFGYT